MGPWESVSAAGAAGRVSRSAEHRWQRPVGPPTVLPSSPLRRLVRRGRPAALAIWPRASLPTIVARQVILIDHSDRGGRSHATRDLRATLALNHGDVVLALQIEPELRAIAEMAAEAQRRVCGN
jgi:hypothetical protein